MSNWSGWASLEGRLSGGKLVVAQNLDGRLEVFGQAAGAGGPELGHVWQTVPNAGWSDWSSLGAPPGEFLGAPAAGRNADGRLEVFVRVGLMSTGELWHIWQTSPGEVWGSWSNLGGWVGAHVLEVAQNQDGRLEVFAVSPAGTLRHIWQTAPNAGWNDWADLGTPAGQSLTASLAIGQNADGRLEVFAVSGDGTLWHLWQQAANGGWSDWASLGSPAGTTLGELAVASNQDGRLEVFESTSTALWHLWQTSAGGAWSDWASLAAPSGVALRSPAAAKNADGRLEVFAFGLGDAVWHAWQTSPGGAWSGWDSLGGLPSASPAVAANADGRLEIFELDSPASGQTAAWHRWQESAGGGWATVAAEWRSRGPVDAISALAVDLAGTILAAGATGVWRSNDRGESWTKVSPTLLGSSIDYAPSGGLAWAVSHDAKSILSSADGGAAWTSRYSTSGQGHINSVLADRATPGTVWAGMSATDTLAQVLRSSDNGATWTAVLPASLRGGGGLSPTNAGPLAALPGVAGLVLAGVQYYHSGGVLKSSDGGSTWTLAYNDSETPLAGASALAAAGSSAAGASVYAGLNVQQFGSLVRSADGGTTWSNLSAGLPIQGSGTGGFVANLVLEPNQPDTAYMSMWDTSSPMRTGVFVSADAGLTWTELGHLEFRVAGPGGLAIDSSQTLFAATANGVFSYPV